MPLDALVATRDRAWAERLAGLAGSLGWTCRARGRVEHLGPAQSEKGLLLVDWDLLGPGPGGKEHLARLRLRLPGWLLVLAASPGDLLAAKIAAGLAWGADEILSKAASDKALLSGLKACAERLAHLGAPVISAHGLKADRLRRRVSVSDGRGAWREGPALSPREFDLLWLFLENPGRTLERPFILTALWRGRAGHVNPEALDKHVQALRRKLGRQGRRIVTVHGQGYALR